MSDPGTRREVFITGATGAIGRAITGALLERGDHVVTLTRTAPKARAAFDDRVEVIEGDPTEPGVWQEAVAGCDAAINLVGEPLDRQRWNARFRQKLLDSRVDATRHLVQAIDAAGDARPRVLVSASGADYYPFSIAIEGVSIDDDDDAFDESAPGGDGFLARMCRDWEDEAVRAEPLGVRVARMRTGIVLHRDSATVKKLALPFKMFAGGKIGDGRQWFSWIHMADAVGGYLLALDRLSGPINLVASSDRQRDVARALGKALHRPSWLPVPKFALRTAVGPLAEYVLHGRQVIPAALRAAGYEFQYPTIADAFAEIYG